MCIKQTTVRKNWKKTCEWEKKVYEKCEFGLWIVICWTLKSWGKLNNFLFRIFFVN